jgi:hypothetical protein
MISSKEFNIKSIKGQEKNLNFEASINRMNIENNNSVALVS